MHSPKQLDEIKLTTPLFEKEKTIVSEFEIEFDGEEFSGELHQFMSMDEITRQNSIYWIDKTPILNSDEIIFEILWLT